MNTLPSIIYPNIKEQAKINSIIKIIIKLMYLVLLIKWLIEYPHQFDLREIKELKNRIK